MPKRYDIEAVTECEKLYLRFNGQQHDRIEHEMRRKWPGWSKQNLYSRGDKVGWIEKYGWESALKQKIAASSEQGALSFDEQLIRDIDHVRQRVKAQLDALGTKVDRDLVYQFRDFCKLIIDARTKLQARSDTLGGFVAFWERLLDWLPDISEKAARELLSVAEQILERAAAEYGETDDRAEANSGSKD